MQKIDLNKRNSYGILNWLESWNEPDGAKLVESKINELVDAVNEIMTWRFETEEDNDCDPKHREQPVDQYTEQPNCPEQMGYIKLDSDSLAKFLKIHPEYNNNGVIEIPKKEPADPYAEQRKWIGKLGWFSNGDGFDEVGYLTEIVPDMPEAKFRCNCHDYYEECKPVKPDDDIIYKGE